MASRWEVRGVPRALALDMWWLTEADEGTQRPEQTFGWDRIGLGGRAAALALLVILADFLFYRQALGLSLAVFAAAVLAVVMALSPHGERLRPALLLAAASLPVIDYVQALSLAFLGVGLLVSLAWATGGVSAIGHRALWIMADLPFRGLRDSLAGTLALANGEVLRDHRRDLRAWAFPLGGSLILIALLLAANPVLDRALARLLSFDAGGLVRLMFWAGAALIIWPLIAPSRPLSGRAALPRLPGPSAGSVAKGLVMFNLILGVQTLLDAVYLWGGASLPEGMTAAEYAHRGAYPLLATALLAGGFALAARLFAREDRQLRGLLLLWLAQNVALTVSALLRLELYVAAFGLTYLRLHAAIWMGLVAVGLGLTGWQVWRGLPNRWLLLRAVGLGMGTLYVACFVNFAAIIAQENLSREEFDGAYVCSLGPTAAAAIRSSGREVRVPYEYGGSAMCDVEAPQADGWRDWGFRNWRVRRYLDALAGGAHEDPRRG
jgi:Domain of unknown function (DUF4173)